MSKKYAHQQKKSGKPPLKSRSPRKAITAVLLLLSLSVAGLVLAQWRSIRRVTNHLSLTPAPQTTPSPQLSKEYIYAGGKLVAIEEPAATGGSGPPPTNLLATATSGTTVSLTWTAPTGSISSYQVERSQSISGPYTTLSPNPTTTSVNDSTASAGIAYLYRVRAVYTAGGYSDYSTKDLATTIMFIDNPLVVGTTPINAQHLTELRQAVNAVRTLAGPGLGQATWTYPDPVSTPTMLRRPIYLKDVTELRSELDEALTILNLTQPYPATPPLASGSPVSAAHFTQIRDRVK